MLEQQTFIAPKAKPIKWLPVLPNKTPLQVPKLDIETGYMLWNGSGKTNSTYECSKPGRPSYHLFWTCHVLIGDNGFFQGMFQSVTVISTIDSHFVLALPVPQYKWLSPPLIHILLYQPHQMCIGDNGVFRGPFQSITDFPHCWFTFQACSPAPTHTTSNSDITKTETNGWLHVPQQEKL